MWNYNGHNGAPRTQPWWPGYESFCPGLGYTIRCLAPESPRKTGLFGRSFTGFFTFSGLTMAGKWHIIRPVAELTTRAENPYLGF